MTENAVAEEIRYDVSRREVARLSGWSPVKGSTRRLQRSRWERADLYNRLLRRAQRARTGIYETPTGGQRHVFFDPAGRKHVLERHDLVDHVPNARRPRVMQQCKTVLLDEVIVHVEDGTVERLAHKWHVSVHPCSWELEPVLKAFAQGLDSLEPGPAVRSVYRRSGNTLAGYEVVLGEGGEDPAFRMPRNANVSTPVELQWTTR